MQQALCNRCLPSPPPVHSECHSYSLNVSTLDWQPLMSNVCHRLPAASATNQQGPLADIEIHQIITEVRLQMLISATTHWTSPKPGGFATSRHTTGWHVVFPQRPPFLRPAGRRDGNFVGTHAYVRQNVTAIVCVQRRERVCPALSAETTSLSVRLYCRMPHIETGEERVPSQSSGMCCGPSCPRASSCRSCASCSER